MRWKNPVLYMSRETTREVWLIVYGFDPNLLSGELRFGQSRIPVLYDDRMPIGEARIEEGSADHAEL